MRIVLITGEYPPAEGGVADYTACLAGALVDAGAAVAVITSPVAGVPSNAPSSSPLPGGTRSSADPRVPVHELHGGWGWRALPALTRQLADLGPDIVHIQYQAAAYGLHPAISFLPRWLRRRSPAVSWHTAITYHDLRVPYLFPKAGRLRDVVVREAAWSADAAIVTNPADAATLADWGGARRLGLIPIGSNIPDHPAPGYERQAWRRSRGLEDRPLLAYFGFLGATKGGSTLLGALAALHSGRFGAKSAAAQLVMIGGHVGASDPTNAAFVASFRRQLAELGLEQALHWTGHLEPSEVSAWLHAADVVLLPYHDGASYRRGSLLAALTHGRPIVTTWPSASSAPRVPAKMSRLGQGLGGAPLVDDQGLRPPLLDLPPLEDGRHALLVPPGDAEALARSVARILDDVNLAAKLGSGARELSARFGWPAIAAHHLALYAELLS